MCPLQIWLWGRSLPFCSLHRCCNLLKCKMHYFHLCMEQKNPVSLSIKCRGTGCMPQRVAMKLSTALLSATQLNVIALILSLVFGGFFWYSHLWGADPSTSRRQQMSSSWSVLITVTTEAKFSVRAIRKSLSSVWNQRSWSKRNISRSTGEFLHSFTDVRAFLKQP